MVVLNTGLTVENLRSYLPGGHDVDTDLLKRFLLAATATARKILNHDFDGEEVPEDVKVWILARAARIYERRVEGLNTESFGGQSSGYGSEEFDVLYEYRRNPGT